MQLADLVLKFSSLVGVGTLITVIVNVLKFTGWVKDGQAMTWSTGLNLLGLAALFVIGIYNPQFDLGKADAVAAQVAQILTLVFGLIVQLWSSRGAHNLLRGVPLIGKSFAPAR